MLRFQDHQKALRSYIKKGLDYFLYVPLEVCFTFAASGQTYCCISCEILSGPVARTCVLSELSWRKFSDIQSVIQAVRQSCRVDSLLSPFDLKGKNSWELSALQG